MKTLLKSVVPPTHRMGCGRGFAVATTHVSKKHFEDMSIHIAHKDIALIIVLKKLKMLYL